MSFGKRRTTQDAKPSRTVPSRKWAPNAAAPSPNRSTALVMAGIAGGLALIGLVITGYSALMHAAGRKLDEKFSAQVSQTIHPTPQLALLKTRGAEGWTLGNCQMRRPPAAADSNNPESSYAERDQSYGGMLEHFGGDFSVALVNTADFLECVATQEPQRLCAGDVRSAFAADVARFYDDHKAQTREFDQNNWVRDPKFAAVMKTLSDANPEFGEATGVIGREMLGAVTRVDDALRTAAANGYVSSADFGWSTPVRAKDILTRTKAGAKPCS